MTTTITGASDDLIEVEGDITEEFNVYLENGDSVLIAFSDGTLLSAIYDNNGIWRLHKVFGGGSKFHKEEGDIREDTMDKITLSGIQMNWVLLGNRFKARNV